ncbi:MAG TPA: DUF5668 domain-containing protein [Candidatus Nanoarchaeia archaeon]|nr:hypothetical protein [uncultured archaeon]
MFGRNSYNSNGRQSGGFSLSALLLITLGIIFLLNNFGLLPWELWSHLWKFWPILLILFGLEIIIGRHSSPRGLVILLALIFLVPIVLILNPLTGNPLATSKETFVKPLANLTRARVNFQMQSANIKINSLEASSTSAFKGEIRYSQLLPKPALKEDKLSGEGSYTFSQSSPKGLPFLSNLGNSANFELSRLIPLEINLKVTSGVLILNLSNLKVDLIEVESAAGQVNITFAKDYSTKVFIRTNAGLVSLTIPPEVAASIKTEANFKAVKLNESRFPKVGDTYKSPDFTAKPFKVEVEISGQAASVEVK